MARRIQRLDELTINKIAAGEVIENPASVVKELVENSLDAASTEICVEILGGGRDLIRISDNGSGMGRDDALLSIERYATSKITSVEDIFSIHTMGFRGEALASIASIAKVTLITAQHPDADDNSDGAGAPATAASRAYGTLLLSDGGKIVSCGDAVRDPGTTIEVKALFFNLPVRKKFLRSPAYDAQEIHRVLGILAMANPKVLFRLISNEKVLLNAPIHKGAELMIGRLKDVLGAEFAAAAYPVIGERSGYSLEGVISQPCYTRPNRTGQYLFINRRAVTSPLVAQAIREGYGTALADGRHPLWVIYLTIPEGLVDVNVHPQKKEVRLRQQELLRELLVETIRAAMQRRPLPALQQPQEVGGEHHPTAPSSSFSPGQQPARAFSSPPPFERAIIEQIIREEQRLPSPAANPLIPQFQPPHHPVESLCNPVHILAVLPPYLLLDPMSAGLHPAFQQTLSAQGGLVLLDIKAAQSRIFFEELVKATNLQKLETQILLIPAAVELSSVEASVILAQITPLQERGIRVRQADEKTFLIEAMPQILTNLGPAKFLKDLVHELLEEENSGEGYLEKQWKRALAHAAMRRANLGAGVGAVRNLSHAEADALIKRLLCCELPTRSPYGGATLIQIGEQELTNRFNK